jgi:hypothetical protein
MTPKSFSVLAGLTAVAVAAAVWTSMPHGGGAILSSRGETLLPSLAGKASDIAAIKVESKDHSIEMRRAGEQFLDASGYPVKGQAVRELVESVAGMTIQERKTDDPKREAEIDLAKPDAKEGAGTRVTFLDKDGKPIAGVVLGKRDYTVGGVSGGQFVRRAGEDQAWLVRGAGKLPAARSGWFDTELIGVNADEITGVTIENGKGTVDLVPGDKGLTLASVPDGAKPDTQKIGRIARYVGTLDFEDVRDRDAKAVTSGEKLTLRLKDGASVTLIRLAGDAKSGSWFRFETTAPAQGEAPKSIATLAKRAPDFDFRLSPSLNDMMGWSADDLVQKTEG